MHHPPSSIRAEVPMLPADATDAELDARIAAPPTVPGGRSSDTDDDAASVARFGAAGGVAHAIVAEWPATWGAPDHQPFRNWYAARNG